MRPTRLSLLAVLAVVVGVATWIGVSNSYANLPPLPWSAIPTFVLLGLGEAYTGLNLRARIRRRPDTRPVEPLTVARMVVLAKATAYVAAAFAGLFAGFAIYVLTSLEKAAPRQDAVVALGSLAASIALVGAALFLEHCCRVPKPPRDEEEKGISQGRA